ncbi:hypothetical protein TRFO_20925 [Tritrichomonas foetus]|uniref:Uncharacterized protein n=1 Tax=Tritrichomonas foetus TaxID=1144522 RepID=A0A1J4KJL3_9EUKA|nr:hypothetical protein TRFO_20925 [Tritrichomonas foetus]|eukprot:OHT10012.1 hypothetical protein TRFO_20925 [Tritrichomonas foetus]
MEALSIAEYQLKCIENEKRIQGLENQVYLLKNELDQKDQILSQTNNELNKLQKSYKEALNKIVELSSKHTTNENDHIKHPENNSKIYKNQINKQSVIISDLNDRLWNSEFQRRAVDCYPKHFKFELFRNHSNNKNNDPENNNTINKIAFLKKELKKWRNCLILIFDICSDALERYYEFPKHDHGSQRRMTVDLVEQLAKKKTDDSEIIRKYENLQKKYNELNTNMDRIKNKCNYLSEKTKYINENKFGELSRIEETVKSKNYFIEPPSIRNVSNVFTMNQFSAHLKGDKDLIKRDKRTVEINEKENNLAFYDSFSMESELSLSKNGKTSFVGESESFSVSSQKNHSSSKDGTKLDKHSSDSSSHGLSNNSRKSMSSSKSSRHSSHSKHSIENPSEA